MKKKLFVLLVILAVVLTGVFADETEKTAYGQSTIMLRGSISSEFVHGVVDGTTLKPAETFENALAPGGVEFNYGYRSNELVAGGKIYMTVTDFKSGENTIKIKSIEVGGTPISDPVGVNGIEIIDGISATGSSITSATIKIVAAQNDSDTGLDGAQVGEKKSVNSAEPGTYTATLTFKVFGE